MKNLLKSVRLDESLAARMKPVMKKKGLNFSNAVTEALEQYVRAEEFSGALEEARGAWPDKNHPEDTAAYIRKIRKGRKK
jgi:antitoxin component of RelBE/YafQ-DinJ toxin-antitoxin module